MRTINGYVANNTGLTSRLSVDLVSEANKYKSHIEINVLEETADLKSIMNVMALVVPHGEDFTITIEGEDEEVAESKIIEKLKMLNLNK